MFKKAIIVYTIFLMCSAVLVYSQSVKRSFYRVFAAQYGSSLNGTTLTNFVDRMGDRFSYVVIDGGRWDVDKSVTFPTNLHLVFAADTYFDISNGVTVTVNGGVDAGYFTVFQGSGIVTGAPKADYWNPLWDQSKGGTGVIQSADSSEILRVVTNTQTIVYKTGTTQSFYYAECQDSLVVASNLTVSNSITLGGVARDSWPGFDTNVVPAGTILPWGSMSNAPSGFLFCDGTGYETNGVYSNLYFTIGTNFGFNIAAGKFRVPDLRGYFLRGWDNGQGRDPDAADRLKNTGDGNSGDNVGSRQVDSVQAHNHTFPTAQSSDGTDTYLEHRGQSADDTQTTTQMSFPPGAASSTTTNETRPKNVYVNFIIKH